MRKSTAAIGSVVWFVALGGMFACLLPFSIAGWHFHHPVAYWVVAQAVGVLLICAGLVPLVSSFLEFFRANGTPIPIASPPRLVVSGFYRYVRNPIYVGFMILMVGETLLFGSLGLVEYTAISWCVGAAFVHWYEEPALTRKFGTEYQNYRHAVRAWFPRLHPWVPSGQ